MSKHTCPKVNIEAVRDAVFKLDINFVAKQKANGLYINIGPSDIETDDVIALSIILYGVHNAFRIGKYIGENNLFLHAGVYKILPEFLIPGEEIEFEL